MREHQLVMGPLVIKPCENTHTHTHTHTPKESHYKIPLKLIRSEKKGPLTSQWLSRERERERESTTHMRQDWYINVVVSIVHNTSRLT